MLSTFFITSISAEDFIFEPLVVPYPSFIRTFHQLVTSTHKEKQYVLIKFDA